MSEEQSNAVQTSIAESGDSRICPFCAETIKAAAIVCCHCGRDLRPRKRKRFDGSVLLSLVIIGCIAYGFYVVPNKLERPAPRPPATTEFKDLFPASTIKPCLAAYTTEQLDSGLDYEKRGDFSSLDNMIANRMVYRLNPDVTVWMRNAVTYNGKIQVKLRSGQEVWVMRDCLTD
jgi:hypothetical protein